MDMGILFCNKNKPHPLLQQRETKRMGMQEEVGTQNRQKGSRNSEPGKSHLEERGTWNTTALSISAAEDADLWKGAQSHLSFEKGHPEKPVS